MSLEVSYVVPTLLLLSFSSETDDGLFCAVLCLPEIKLDFCIVRKRRYARTRKNPPSLRINAPSL